MSKHVDIQKLNPCTIAGQLLISDDYLVIPEELARLLGLQGAALLKQIDALAAAYEKHENLNFYHDGHYWVKGSLSWFANRYPYFGSESTIKRIFSDLEKKGLLISSTHNKLRQDRSKSYRCDRQKLGELYLTAISNVSDHQVKMTQSSGQLEDEPSGQNDPMHQVKMTQSSSGQNDPMHQVKMTSSLYQATLSNSLSNCVSNAEPDPPSPNPIAQSFQNPNPEPPQSAPSDPVIDAEIVAPSKNSRQDAIVPLFSDGKIDVLEVLIGLQPDKSSFEFRNLSGAVKSELRLNPAAFYPWNRDRDTLRLFVEFMVNGFSRRRTAPHEARSIVETWIRKANQCVPDKSKKDYSLVAVQWSKFIENAQDATSVEELVEKKPHKAVQAIFASIAREAEERRAAAHG